MRAERQLRSGSSDQRGRAEQWGISAWLREDPHRFVPIVGSKDLPTLRHPGVSRQIARLPRAGEGGGSVGRRMRAAATLSSVEAMNIALFLMMLIGPLMTAVITATTAKKTNERYRARRAARRA